jgi:hypothetical protein
VCEKHCIEISKFYDQPIFFYLRFTKKNRIAEKRSRQMYGGETVAAIWMAADSPSVNWSRRNILDLMYYVHYYVLIFYLLIIYYLFINNN